MRKKLKKNFVLMKNLFEKNSQMPINKNKMKLRSKSSY